MLDDNEMIGVPSTARRDEGGGWMWMEVGGRRRRRRRRIVVVVVVVVGFQNRNRILDLAGRNSK